MVTNPQSWTVRCTEQRLIQAKYSETRERNILLYWGKKRNGVVGEGEDELQWPAERKCASGEGEGGLLWLVGAEVLADAELLWFAGNGLHRAEGEELGPNSSAASPSSHR